MTTLKLTLTDGEQAVEIEVAEEMVYTADTLVLSRCLMTAVRWLKTELNKPTK